MINVSYQKHGYKEQILPLNVTVHKEDNRLKVYVNLSPNPY